MSNKFDFNVLNEELSISNDVIQQSDKVCQ